MNVDLNWCPCGKQSREDSMYCSDACYLKDLASNGNALSRGKYFAKDSFFTGGINGKSINNPMNAASIKIPDVKSMMFAASSNLVFKNRQKYHPSFYSGNHVHTHTHYHIHHGHNHSSRSSVMSSSYESTTSTIDDYFKGQTKMDNSPKQREAILAPPKINENAKDKTEAKSFSSRSSYVIEAVYPVQNFTKSTIAVY